MARNPLLSLSLSLSLSLTLTVKLTASYLDVLFRHNLQLVSVVTYLLILYLLIYID